MHKVRTPWPVAARVSFVVAFEEACRRYPSISARRFCAVRWGVAYHRGRLAPHVPHLLRPGLAHRCGHPGLT